MNTFKTIFIPLYQKQQMLLILFLCILAFPVCLFWFLTLAAFQLNDETLCREVWGDVNVE